MVVEPHQEQQIQHNNTPVEYDCQEKNHAPKDEDHAPTVVSELSDQQEMQEHIPVVYDFPVEEDVNRNELKEDAPVVYNFSEESHAPQDEPVATADSSPSDDHTPSDMSSEVQEFEVSAGGKFPTG